MNTTIPVSDGCSRTVTILQEIIPQYRVPLFDGLRQSLGIHGVALRVAYGTPGRAFAQRGDAAKPLAWGEPLAQGNCRIRNRELVWLDFRKAIRGADLVIATQEVRQLSNLALWGLQEAGGLRLALWGHGRDFSKPSSGGLAERLKRAMSRRPHWWFAYNELSQRTVSALGYPPGRITTLMNSTDTSLLSAARQNLEDHQVQALKARLGLGSGPVGLYLGAMDSIKHLPYLLEAARHLRAWLPDFELLMVGGGPELPVLREATRTEPWIHWVPPQFGEAKALHMLLAEVCLMPAWVGLGIVDGFALGLPLVTTDAFPHSVEIDYLEHGVNGWMVSGQPSALEYAEQIASLLQDAPRLKALRQGGQATASRITLPAMVERFTAGILQALEAVPLGQRHRR